MTDFQIYRHATPAERKKSPSLPDNMEYHVYDVVSKKTFMSRLASKAQEMTLSYRILSEKSGFPRICIDGESTPDDPNSFEVFMLPKNALTAFEGQLKNLGIKKEDRWHLCSL